MIGRVEETSASFEARSAPRPYPTLRGVSQDRQGARPRRAGDRARARRRGDRVMRPRFADSIRSSSRLGLQQKAGHMTASDRNAAREIISCQAEAIHTLCTTALATAFRQCQRAPPPYSSGRFRSRRNAAEHQAAGYQPGSCPAQSFAFESRAARQSTLARHTAGR